ncbi:hypothetical protein Tco_1484252 [Tanacetum coccineum]
MCESHSDLRITFSEPLNKPTAPNSLLAYCGRDLDLGRCASRRDKVKKSKVKGNDKGKGKMPVSNSPEKVSDIFRQKVKWTKMRVQGQRGHHCPFRLWHSGSPTRKSLSIMLNIMVVK